MTISIPSTSPISYGTVSAIGNLPEGTLIRKDRLVRVKFKFQSDPPVRAMKKKPVWTQKLYLITSGLRATGWQPLLRATFSSLSGSMRSDQFSQVIIGWLWLSPLEIFPRCIVSVTRKSPNPMESLLTVSEQMIWKEGGNLAYFLGLLNWSSRTISFVVFVRYHLLLVESVHNGDGWHV